MTVRALFRLISIEHNEGTARIFKFRCDYDPNIPEDQRFYSATPWGEITMQVNNPAVFDQWKIGDKYYADFSPVPPPEPIVGAPEPPEPVAG